jgi:hypothetical protein
VTQSSSLSSGKIACAVSLAGVAFLGCPPDRPVTVCAVPSPPSERAAQLNPTWDRLDENGVAFSPRWAVQGTAPEGPLCLPDPDADEVCGKFPKSGGVPQGRPVCNALAKEEPPVSDIAHGVVCGIGRGLAFFSGHLNYLPASYRGLIWFENHAWPDDDVDFDLLPLEREDGLWRLRRRGLTTQRRLKKGLIPDGDLDSRLRAKGLDYVLHVEAKASESIDQFREEWWNAFRTQGKEERSGMVRGYPAVVTGLLGLDAEHGAFTEIHPAHAVAIQTSCGVPDDTEAGAYVDTWRFFVRNHGNEGWCSQWSLQHMLDPVSGVFTLALPAAFSGEMANVELVASGTTVLSNRAGVRRSPLELANGQILLRLQWPAGLPEDEWLRIHGTLAVRWRPTRGEQPRCLDLEAALSGSPTDPVAASEKPGPPEEREDNAEHFLGQLYGQRPTQLSVRPMAALDHEVVEEAEVGPVEIGPGDGPCPGGAADCGARLRAVVEDRAAAPPTPDAAEARITRPEICDLAEAARQRPDVERKPLEAVLEACRSRE